VKEEFIAVAKASDIPTGQVRTFEHQDRSIAVCNVEGQFYAVEDTCTHDDGPLGEGVLEGCSIECPRHGARFDVRSGEVLQMPAAFPIRTFETKVEQGTVFVKVEANELAGNS